jgi:hypothetical protein
LKHFDKYTIICARGPYRILVLDRHKSYKSAEFQEYYKAYNIITLGLLPYSSYLTQLFDIRCFSILKQAYGRQIEIFIKTYINYITKIKFFLAFTVVYKELITAENTQAGFRGTGLMPFDPQVILLKLDIKLRTLTPSRPFITNSTPWVSQTPSNPTKTFSQTIIVRNRILCYQGSSLTLFFEIVRALAKGIKRIAYKVTLRAANKAFSKRRRAKKARVRQGGTLTIEDTQDIIAQKDMDKQVQRDIHTAGSSRGEGQPSGRRYRTCGKTSYNTRTCQEDIDISSASDSI